MVLGGVVFIMIHAEHQRDVFILRRSRNNDLLYRSTHVLLGLGRIGKTPRGLNYNLSPDGIPGQSSRVFFLKNLNGLALDADAVRTSRDFVLQVPEPRVIFQQMGQSLGISKVVYCDKLNIRIIQGRPQNIAPDSSE